MKTIKYLTFGCLLSCVVACEQRPVPTFSYENIDTTAARGNGGDAATAIGNANDVATPDDMEIKEGTLTAGHWNDLENWDFWNKLMQKPMYFDFQEKWQYYPSQRYQVQLKDNAQQPIQDATVMLKSKNGEIIWQSKTNNKGNAELWAQLFEESKQLDNIIEVVYQGTTQTIESPQTFTQGANILELETAAVAPNNQIDVMLVVDATGSMEDEIAYMKAEFADVIQQVKTQQPAIALQTGAVFYRDIGDEYVTRTSPLSADASEVTKFMNVQSAKDGGDFPEAVDAALKEALADKNWSSSARSRILFLMLDAPAHNEPAHQKSLQASIQAAAKKGIQIVPIASSGIDKKTEFLTRFMAIATNGSYVFLTDHSGVGNEHIEPTVGAYRVELLNELLTRIILQSSETVTPEVL